jgi:hypothetical protein
MKTIINEIINIIRNKNFINPIPFDGLKNNQLITYLSNN